MRDWRTPTRQHDIAEFFQYIATASDMQFTRFHWQAREQRGDRAHILDRGDLGTPLLIDIAFPRLIPGQPHTVQDCIANHFRGQSALVALDSDAPALCLQLKRFAGAAQI